MKHNAITKCVFEYGKCRTNQDKLKLLQQVEGEEATFYERDRRDVAYVNAKQNQFNNNATAFFSENIPYYICLLNTDLDGFSMAISIVHEGIHAAIYDCMNKGGKLSTIGNFDEKEFLKQMAYKDEIRQFFSAQQGSDAFENLFNLGFYEEKIAYEESSLNVLNALINSIETSKDIEKVYNYFISIIEYNHNMNSYIREAEKTIGYSYDSLVDNDLTIKLYENFIRFVTRQQKLRSEE